MTNVRERFGPVPMGVDESRTVGAIALGGFLAVTSGTLTVTTPSGQIGVADVTLVNAVPVTEGIYTPMPFSMPTSQGFTVTLADGASGTLAV